MLIDHCVAEHKEDRKYGLLGSEAIYPPQYNYHTKLQWAFSTMKNGSEVISCTVRSYCELHQSKYDSNRCFKLKVASCQLRSIDTAPWKNGLSKILNVSTHFLWPERHWLCIESEISVLLLLKSEFIVVWVFMFDYRTLFESPRLLPSVNWSWVRYLQKYFHDFIL